MWQREGQLRTLDARTGVERRAWQTDAVNLAQISVFSPTGAEAVLAVPEKGRTSILKRWRTSDGDELKPLTASSSVVALAYSEDGRWLAASLGRTRKERISQVAVWSVTTGEQTALLPVSPLEEVRVLAFSADGRRLAGATHRGEVFLWDVETKELLAVRDAPQGWTRAVRSLAFTPNGHWLAAGVADGRVRIWDTAADRELVLNVGHRIVSALALAPDGKALAVGMVNNNPVTLWDIPTYWPD
jgi:WD40 repeat protein